jgi:DNA-binding XRE family transcriptional regulator
MNLSETEIALAMDSLLAYQQRYVDEITHYEALKRGNLPSKATKEYFGVWLIELRISRGLTQAQLAARMNISPTRVAMQERNEYHGITPEIALDITMSILDGDFS